jgi:ribosome biogenesis GTPase
MKDKASVFSGQSGVGKTSLINLVTGGDLKTSPAVDKTKKGSHTTSKTNLIPLAFGGFCIDTPGIKSFGVWNLTKDEIAGYFPDIEEIGKGCKYQDCSHTGEEG